MKKKHIFIMVAIIMLFPVNVNALTGNISLSCNSKVLTVNSNTTCTLSGYSEEEVSAVSMRISATGNISINNISTSNIWQGNGSDGNIQLYTDSNKKGNFSIATFTIKANSNVGSGVINVNNVEFLDVNYMENPISNNSLSITVKNVEEKKDNNQTNNNSSTNNNYIAPSTNNASSNVNKKSSDATLKSLSVSELVINFSKDVTEYSIEAPYEVENITIKALPSDTKAQVVIPNDLKLKLGKNDFIVKVTAEDGTIKEYNLHITRLDKKLSNNSKLKSLEIEGYTIKFDKDIYTYDLGDIKSSALKIKALSDDKKASVKIHGNDKLGKNDVIEVKVTAEDNSTSSYLIYVNNTKNTNIGLIIVYILFILSLIGNIILFINFKKNKIKI